MDIKKTTYTQKIFEQYKISITDSGYACADETWNSSYVCSPFSRLYYVTYGRGEITLKNEKISLLPGNMYLIPLGTKYGCRCFGKFGHLYFHINIDSPDGYDLFRHAVCAASEIPQEKIVHLKELYLSRDFAAQMELRYEICRSVQVALTLQPKTVEFEASLSNDMIKVVEYIRANLSIRLTTEEIANNLYMSKNTLAKRFRSEAGIPIGKYIDKLIFFEAEKLLTKSSMSVGEISAKFGFCDQFYFSRRFRRLFEETPLEYRKRTRSSAT